MMLASPAAAGAIHVAPVYRKDVKRPADADLRRVCSLTRSLLPSDGVELPFENMALLNTRQDVQNTQSEPRSVS